MKDNLSGSSHLSGSSYPPGGQMSPLIGGSYKTTRNADFGSPSFSYSPSFAGGSSPYSNSRFITRGGGGGGSSNPFSAFLGVS